MAKKFGSQIDLQKIPVLGLVAESAVTGSAPSSPVNGQLWYDTTLNRMYVRENAAWVLASQTGAELQANKGATNGYASLSSGTVPIAQIPTGSSSSTVAIGNDSRLSDARVPTDGSVTGGTAGTGVKIAATTITAANIANATITDTQIAAANKDGVAGTASLRTLGTGATQAAAGNDARFTDTRTPSANSITTGMIIDGAITDADVNAANKDGVAGTASLRTLGYTGTSAMPGIARLDQIAVPTATVSFNSQELTNLAAPTAGSSAARLTDVQNAQAGIDLKPSVRVASTATVVIASALENGDTIDGITLATGDRVLLKNQSTASENGTYVVVASGAASRTTDSINPNSLWLVEQGTANADTSWMVTTDGTITLGSTSLTIAQFGAGGTTYSGTTNRITVSGTVVDISSSYVGQSSLTTLGTITTGTWTGTSIAVANGGTGSTTASGARTNLGAGTTNKYTETMAALVAGVELVITHSLGTQEVVAMFRDASTNFAIEFSWRAINTTTIGVTADVAYASSAVKCVVIG